MEVISAAGLTLGLYQQSRENKKDEMVPQTVSVKRA